MLPLVTANRNFRVTLIKYLPLNFGLRNSYVALWYKLIQAFPSLHVLNLFTSAEPTVSLLEAADP
jgi:hypothetical protein